jgi:hypothetical protein
MKRTDVAAKGHHADLDLDLDLDGDVLGFAFRLAFQRGGDLAGDVGAAGARPDGVRRSTQGRRSKGLS